MIPTKPKQMLLGAALGLLQQASVAQEPLRFDSTNANPEIRFLYPDTATDSYLRTLRETHLPSVATAPTDELQQVLTIVQWTHGLWRHNGNNEPSKGDALTIIKEAKEGRNFRCVEYAKVSADALLATGMKARVLALKTKDAATRPFGAGHVATEVWLSNRNKWVLADAQFNLVPTLDGVPLHAAELQQALVARKNVVFVDQSGPVSEERRKRYLQFITPYLFYFDTPFDHREVRYETRLTHGSFTALMLVPLGYQRPPVFQNRFSLQNLMPTHSIKDFYGPPASK